MKKFKKEKIEIYFQVARDSFGQLWQRRLSFFLGRLANLIFFLFLLLFWQILFSQPGFFSNYTESETVTYLAGLFLLRPLLFGTKSWRLAYDIFQKNIFRNLPTGLSRFWYDFFREAGERSLNFLSALIEVILLAWFFGLKFIPWPDFAVLAPCLLSVLLSVILFYLISNVLNLLSFWLQRIRLYRFLFKRLLEIMSGAYFPLDILSKHSYYLSAHFPFFYLFYFPISIYLGKMQGTYLFGGLAWQVIWIVALYTLGSFVWESGIKRYSGSDKNLAEIEKLNI